MAKSAKARKPLTNTDSSVFCEQMATILTSGISAAEGISILSEESSSEEEKNMLQDISDELQASGSFSEALKASGVFPGYMINMTAIGEETGRLDDVMTSLARHYQREAYISKTIRSSITYPLIMTGMIAVVMIILAAKVLPLFNQVFEQFGSDLTGFSGALMHAGTLISGCSVFLIILICLLAAAALVCINTESGFKKAKGLLCRFAPVSSIIDSTNSCRFADAVAITVSSGLTIERSIELAQKLSDDDRFKNKISRCSDLMAEGRDFHEAARDAGIFTGIYGRMISIGEKTGSTDQTLEQIAALYQDEIDTRMNNLLAALEPALVVILSVIVGIVLLSVMLPLMGVMSGL